MNTQWQLYLGDMVVVCLLIRCKLTPNRLFEWGDTPSLRWVGQISPHLLSQREYGIMFLEGASTCEHPRVMNTAGVTNRVIGEDK
jgi:hypothetical protein